MPTAATSTDEVTTRSPLVYPGVALAGGLLVGMATSVAQGLLPGILHSLANSSGSWSLIAFLLAMLCPRPRVAAVMGVVTLLAMVAGYDVASELRGYATSLASSAFWLVAAVVVGPFLGLGGNAVRTRSRMAPAAIGAISGVLVGEGVYGLTVIADTTSPEYWWASIAVGVGVPAWAVVRRFPWVRPALVAVGTTALVAGGFVVAYTAAPLVLLAI
ncbi:DUF6518 family protein [Marinactinospora rubrisoli]|uniref:DUF6518 family protein n=1 Tax=Marinactinospora rubrisoli TaxID=2715399 RepID=A0ABW2K982_9ACTN